MKTIHLNTYQGIALSVEVQHTGITKYKSGLFAILVYASLVWIPRSNMRLYLKKYLQHVCERRTKIVLF